jgi:hypothetical protein
VSVAATATVTSADRERLHNDASLSGIDESKLANSAVLHTASRELAEESTGSPPRLESQRLSAPDDPLAQDSSEVLGDGSAEEAEDLAAKAQHPEARASSNR